jgi:uncharacterized MAPEG superfamily protein
MTIPFVCVFLAAVLIYVPRIMVLVAQARMPGGLDNKDPRGQQALLTGWGKRAQGAHLNAFEAFAPFAAAVFVSHLGGADPHRAALFAIAFVAFRVVYTGLYLANLDSLRSLVWFLGLGSMVALFVSPWLG